LYNALYIDFKCSVTKHAIHSPPKGGDMEQQQNRVSLVTAANKAALDIVNTVVIGIISR